jgi:hypothetical protein
MTRANYQAALHTIRQTWVSGSDGSEQDDADVCRHCKLSALLCSSGSGTQKLLMLQSHAFQGWDQMLF